MSAIAYAIQFLQLVPLVIAAGLDVKAFIGEGNAQLALMDKEGRNPTDQEWEELRAKRHGLEQAIHDKRNSLGT